MIRDISSSLYLFIHCSQKNKMQSSKRKASNFSHKSGKKLKISTEVFVEKKLDEFPKFEFNAIIDELFVSHPTEIKL